MDRGKGAMINSFLNLFFGCSHQRTTFPITPGRRSQLSGSNYSGAKRTNGTYVVCLDCGKEFAYNWRDMRVGQAVDQVTGTAAEPVVSHR